MYLHLGQDTVVSDKEVLGIFDLDTSTVSKTTRDYLSLAEKEKRVINVSFELPKSFVVCSDKKDEKVKIYLSPISSSTLRKRMKNLSF